MNTIPITFNDTLPSYTAVGGALRRASTGLSAVLLNRGGRYPRRTLFQELEKIGFDYIISLEGPQERYDVEELSGRFPFVRFILLQEALSPGEQINLAVSELTSPLFFVLRNDLRILHGGGAARMADRLLLGLEDSDKRGESPSKYKRLCTVPLIQNAHFETLPTIIAPALLRGAVKTHSFVPLREGMPTLYPFDGVGIYDRERFIRLGGFDNAVKSPHWQLMDFGFRAYLWGETIKSTQVIRLSYNGDPPAEDGTAEESYRRFYLKNLAPNFRGGTAHIPIRCFPTYFLRTGGDLFASWEEFFRGRRWVKTNRYFFRCDARAIADLWEDIEACPGDPREEAGKTELIPPESLES